MFKNGDTAFIKTSNEEVFILGISGNLNPFEGSQAVLDDIGPFSGSTVIVRRAKLGQDGITHVVDYFLSEELETLEDRVRREKDCQDRVRNTIASLDGKSATAAEPSLMN